MQSTEAKLGGEIAKVVQSVQNEFLSAQAQERSLSEALNTQKTDALSLNRRGIEYGVLRREAESNKQMYELLMQRAKEADISGELKTSNIRVVDQAEVPRGPIRPNKPRDMMLGLLGGLVAGIGLAFFMEYLDNRVKNPDEIKQFLGVSFLGLIPGLREKEIGQDSALLITGAAASEFRRGIPGHPHQRPVLLNRRGLPFCPGYQHTAEGGKDRRRCESRDRSGAGGPANPAR